MPDTTVRVEYIGAVQNFSEVTITGNQQVWRIGSSAFVETGRASQLVASGKFRSLANDPAMLPANQAKVGAIPSSGEVASSRSRSVAASVGGETAKLATGNQQYMRPQVIFDPSNPVALTLTPGSGCTIVSFGYETYYGETCFRITATAEAGANAYFDVLTPGLAAGSEAYCDGFAYEFGLDYTEKWVTFAAYIGSQSNFSRNINGSFQTPNATTSLAPMGSGMSHYAWYGSQIGKGTLTVVETEPFTHSRLRCTVKDGQTATIWIRSLVLASHRQKARFCQFFDDGYTSVIQAAKIANRYGIPLTVGVIYPCVGTPGFMTLDQLKWLVDQGHECVAHGPNVEGTYGAGNMFENYATDAGIVDDFSRCRDWLLKNGLTNDRGAQCLIWPQGIYQRTPGDKAVLQMLYAAGFRLGRGVTANFADHGRPENISPLNPYRFAINVSGHSFGGTFGATTAGEASNTAALQTKWANAVAARSTSIIEYHKLVAGAGVNAVADGAMTSIMIRDIDYDVHCSSQAAYVAQGTAEFCTFSDLL
jgi:hypothetical protein